MNPQSIKLVWPLAVAVVLCLADTSIMGGQLDSDETLFQPPIVATDNDAQPPNNIAAPQIPNVQRIPSGKANLTQGSTIPQKTRQYPIDGKPPLKFDGKPLQPSPPRNYQSSTARPSTTIANRPASPIVQASANATDSAVKTASHVDPMQGVTPDGGDPILLQQQKRRVLNAPPLVTTPTDRGAPPGVRGALFGLNGETATERLLQMRTTALELERENEELRVQNAGLLSRVKESHEQLTAGVREIQMARKELTLARSDLDRLRNDLQSLRDKVRIAEREYSAVLQSMGPLLQQLLESDDVSALPPNPTE